MKKAPWRKYNNHKKNHQIWHQPIKCFKRHCMNVSQKIKLYITFCILSFIEMSPRCMCVSVCLSVCVWTFLNARPDQTRGSIFIKFGTQTKMLIRYGLPKVLWDASILWRHSRVFLLFEAASGSLLFCILSFIEMTEYFNTDRGNQNEPEVYVCVCVSVCVSVEIFDSSPLPNAWADFHEIWHTN